jgi:hypothetical protein
VSKLQRNIVDAAKNFKPDKILLWDKASDNLESQRIINLFKNAEVKIVKNQKLNYFSSLFMAEALQNSTNSSLFQMAVLIIVFTVISPTFIGNTVLS